VSCATPSAKELGDFSLWLKLSLSRNALCYGRIETILKIETIFRQLFHPLLLAEKGDGGMRSKRLLRTKPSNPLDQHSERYSAPE